MIKKIIKVLKRIYHHFYPVPEQEPKYDYPNVTIYEPSFITKDVIIGEYTYISEGSKISMTEIGKFCSIGPHLLCGWGIHPINGISTSPMFYSTKKQNGMTLSDTDKCEERKKIIIGNDVFIGANVTILDGVKIGNGCVIGAGAVVTKDIPDYAVVGGVPAKIIKYRFSDEQISALKKIEWWNWEYDKLKNIEKYFFNIDDFIKEFS